MQIILYFRVMIFDITPYRTDKNIGKAYNERIAVLPDDAWVIIRDGDCMYLTPDYGHIIDGIIANHGDEYALIGALTNRLGIESLCYGGEFSEQMDIQHHFLMALGIKADGAGKIKESDLCAGFFMMFKKETWLKVGGFSENLADAPYTDKRFCAKIKEAGSKIGIAQDLYLFHSYRIWEKSHKEAWKSTQHLR